MLSSGLLSSIQRNREDWVARSLNYPRKQQIMQRLTILSNPCPRPGQRSRRCDQVVIVQSLTGPSLFCPRCPPDARPLSGYLLRSHRHLREFRRVDELQRKGDYPPLSHVPKINARAALRTSHLTSLQRHMLCTDSLGHSMSKTPI